MDFTHELIMTLQIILAFLLGGILGWEREHRGRAAGIRTFATISVGACVFGLISLHGAHDIAGSMQMVDPSRIASNIVVGVGFLGAGIIFRGEGNKIAGLTTAASLWTTAAVGLAVAYEMYFIAIVTTILMFILLFSSSFSWWKFVSTKQP